MLDTLDSRGLRLTDTYSQLFPKAGEYPYALLPAMTRDITDNRPFIIKVVQRERGEAAEQHTINVHWRGGRFEPEQHEVTIAAGDLVMWHCPDQGGLPYVVAGARGAFGSDRLASECCYSHAFGTPGEYRWVDAWGSGTSGTVRVRAPDTKDDKAADRWRKAVADGTVVSIEGDKVSPAQVTVSVGQTVFFAVVKGRGISITDERLLGKPAAEPAPAKKPDRKPVAAKAARRK
jgi:plastocyanin